MKWYWALLGAVLVGGLVVGVCLVTSTKAGKAGDEVISIGGPGKVPSITVNFGKVYYGQTAHRAIALHNASSRTLLLHWQTTCGCTRISVANAVLRPGEKSLLSLAYTELADGITTQAVAQKFVVYDGTAGENVHPLLRGVVRGACASTLLFNRDAVGWLFVPGRLADSATILTATNEATYPISVEWSREGRNRFFSVSPETAEIVPGHLAKFRFRLARNTDITAGPLTGDITARATVLSPRRPIALRFVLPVSASPTPAIQAVPGAILLWPKSGTQTLRRTVRFVLGPDLAGPPRVLGVATSSPALRAVLRRGFVQISLHWGSHQSIFQGDVFVTYLYEHSKLKIDIPVFAASNVPAPRKTVASAPKKGMIIKNAH